MNTFRIVYFDRTANGDIDRHESLQWNMPIERVRKIAMGAVYDYANYFRIEPIALFNYCYQCDSIGLINTVARSLSEADSKVKNGILISITPL